MRETVLLVDDNELFRVFTKALLAGDGYEVVGEACDGAAAIEAARRLQPAIVLLDVQLPDIDGFEVARRLRAEPVRVVLTSGRERIDYGGAVEACGARAFIAKRELSGDVLRTALER